jgi:hypothetical protein
MSDLWYLCVYVGQNQMTYIGALVSEVITSISKEVVRYIVVRCTKHRTIWLPPMTKALTYVVELLAVALGIAVWFTTFAAANIEFVRILNHTHSVSSFLELFFVYMFLMGLLISVARLVAHLADEKRAAALAASHDARLAELKRAIEAAQSRAERSIEAARSFQPPLRVVSGGG